MEKRKYFLGIDQGTTGTTALVLDENWSVRAEAHGRHQQFYPKPGWVEHDPEELLAAVTGTAEQALRSAGISADEVICAGLDHQGETVVVWNKTTGRAIYPAIVWQDRRTADQIAELSAEQKERIREKTGLLADSYFGATKIRWILDHTPGAAEMLKRGELLAGSSDVWFIWRMTGGRTFATDYTSASRTMLFNIHENRWDPELLELFGIPENILPEIKSSADDYGIIELVGADGRLCPVPLTADIVDQQAALLGQACLEPGMVKTTYGTGCFMLMNTGTTPISSANGLLSSVAWKLKSDETRFALDGGIYTAGAAIGWLQEKMNFISSPSESGLLAKECEDTAGVAFVPALTGLAAPHWDPYARGMIIGLTPGTEKKHIVRAALESIACQVRDILDLMERDSGIHIHTMRVDGGLTANEFLMQYQADLLGIPIDVPVITETTALGSAYIAAYGSGHFRHLGEVAENWKRARRYEPQMSESERRKRLERWHRAVERAKHWAEEEEV